MHNACVSVVIGLYTAGCLAENASYSDDFRSGEDQTACPVFNINQQVKLCTLFRLYIILQLFVDIGVPVVNNVANEPIYINMKY